MHDSQFNQPFVHHRWHSPWMNKMIGVIATCRIARRIEVNMVMILFSPFLPSCTALLLTAPIPIHQRMETSSSRAWSGVSQAQLIYRLIHFLSIMTDCPCLLCMTIDVAHWLLNATSINIQSRALKTTNLCCLLQYYKWAGRWWTHWNESGREWFTNSSNDRVSMLGVLRTCFTWALKNSH